MIGPALSPKSFWLRCAITCVLAAGVGCKKPGAQDDTRHSTDGTATRATAPMGSEPRGASHAIRDELKNGPAFTVASDRERVRLHGDTGSDETMRWTEVRKISILTTDEGPQLSDVFINLEAENSKLVIPQDARDNDAFIASLLKIDGFDISAFTKAITSTENAEFTCWTGRGVSFRGN
jgi:hypothetical protein